MKQNHSRKIQSGNQLVLVVIKPDGMNQFLAGEILQKFCAVKLELVAARVLKVSRTLAEKHYKHIKGQPFYAKTIDVMLGKFYPQKQVLAMIFFGKDAIRKCRDIAGATNPEEADPKSIRGSFGRVTPDGIFENVVHASSDPREAEREIKLWFKSAQIDFSIYPVKK